MIWNNLVLEDACDLITRGISPKYLQTGGIRVLNQKCIRNHLIDYNLARRHDISKKRIKEDRFIKKGDVLINSTGHGTLGRMAQVRIEPDEPTTVDSHITIIRPKTELFYLDYFGYAAIYIENKIENAGIGTSGQIELSKTKLKKEFYISFPSNLDEQKLIVNKLDVAFAQIDKAIKVVGCQKEYTKNLIDSKLEELFNNKKYEEHRMDDVCTFVGGSQPPKSVFEYEKSENNIRLIQIRDYKSDKYIVFIPKVKAKRFCNKSDVMIGRYGPPVFQILRGIEGAYNVALMKAIPKDNILNDYLFYFLKNRKIQNFVINKSKRAAGQSGVNKYDLEPYKINLPSLDIQKLILNKSEKIDTKNTQLSNIYKRKYENLISLKSAILTQLIHNEAA